MHEWALAESVIASSLGYAKDHKLRVIREITLGIGELQAIDIGIFKFALGEIKKTYKETEETIIRFKMEPTGFHCMRCGHEWLYSDTRVIDEHDKECIHFIPELYLVYMRCPHCGSHDFEINKGRGVTIKSIKGSKSGIDG